MDKYNKSFKTFDDVSEKDGDVAVSAKDDVSEGTLFGEASAVIDSDGSTTSKMTVESGECDIPRSKFWADRRKRPHLAVGRSGSDSASSDEATPAAKVAAARRGRGRPPTTGQHVGLAKTKAELAKAKRAELELDAEEEVVRLLQKSKATAGKKLLSESSSSQAGEMTAGDLQERVKEGVEIIQKVAARSGNLKGTFQRALKDAAAFIKEATTELSGRSVSDETMRLRADNTRLQAEISQLRKELSEMKDEMRKICQENRSPMASSSPSTSSPSPLDVESLMRNVMVQVGTMINARLDSLQDRLLPEKRLRPTLAADSKKLTNKSPPSVPLSFVQVAAGPSAEKSATKTPTQSSSSMETAESNKKKKNKKRGKKKTQAAIQAAASRRDLSGPKPKPSDKDWVKVGKGGKARAEPEQLKSQPLQRPPKLRPPSSMAVVITLQPGAEERGVTYAAVLAEARSKIDLADLGIESLRFRKAVAGGRILEVPGATSGEKADSLAAKLRDTFKEEDIRITRPTKCAELRVTGLDDSASANDVAAAIARVGGCSVAAVNVGEVRLDRMGLGTTWVRCPVTAAKKVEQGGRLQVGWVSAQVKVLQQKPMTCYRCLEKGHVRGQCESEVDRSDLCFRCGKPGHRSKNCSAEPHCALCEEAKKPAAHKIGSMACAAPSNKKRREANAQKQTACPATAEMEVEDVTQK